MTQEELLAKIEEVEKTYKQTEDVINHPADHSPAKVDAAIRYLAGCGTYLANLRAQIK